MVNAQAYLDEKYPKEERKNRKELLDLRNCGLEGSLDLSDFETLEELDCGDNKLTALKLNKGLKKLWCYDNQLTELEISDLTNLVHLDCRDNLLKDLNLFSAKSLTYLTIRNNDFLEKDLSMFRELKKLEVLYIGNDDSGNKKNKEKFEDNKYNRFYGSLEPLKGLENLRELSISNTNVDSGLKDLPKSVKEFYHSADLIEKAEVKKIEQGLKGKLPSEREKDGKELLSRTEDVQKTVHQLFGGYSNKEIRELKSPQEIETTKHRIETVQWIGRFVAAGGGALTLMDYNPMIGGTIGVVYPVFDSFVSYYKQNYCDSNESKWEGFSKDSRELWNDYRELVDSLEAFEIFSGDSAKELWTSVQEAEKELEKMEKDKEDTQKIESKRNQLKELKKLKDYQTWLLWEKVKKVYKGERQEEDLVTKDKFAQDLWNNWEDKTESDGGGWIRVAEKGRKNQWKEIGEILAEMRKSESHQELENEPQPFKGKQIEIVVDNQQYHTQIVQPTYGTFSGSSKK